MRFFGSILLLFCLFQLPALAQEEDIESRTGVSFEREIIDDFTAEIELEARQFDNLRTFKVFIIEPALAYKINKRFDVGIIYRLSLEPTETKQRLAFEFKADEGFKRFDFSNRLRFQKDFEVNELPENLFRDRILISYNIRKSKLSPYVNAEAFYLLHYKGNRFDQLRLGIGFDYKISKRLDLEAFFIREWQINQSEPVNTNIFGISLSVEVKKRKKKD